MACPFARSCFNLALKGSYDFLDGFVAPHSCDTVERMYHIWHHHKPSSFNHFINVPHMMGPSSDEFYKKELLYFIKKLEEWSGQKMDTEKLRASIRLYNRRRAVLRELYELRKADPPPVSGTEITKVLVAGMGIPERSTWNWYVNSSKRSRAGRRGQCRNSPASLSGETRSMMSAFIKLIEECGAQVVMDDLCTGTRFFWEDVPETDDPLDGIARRYLCTHCPRSNTPRR